MATAIFIIVVLGILDAMLFLACFELEKLEKRYEIWEEEHERSNSKADK